MLLGIIGKRFQDAGLRDLCVESQVIVEGSVSGVLEGQIQPCCAATQACIRSPDEAGVVRIPGADSGEA